MSAERDLKPEEKEILSRLLAKDFPGSKELKLQLRTAKAKPIEDDSYGSIEIVTNSEVRAEVEQNVPVEAFTVDSDGMRVSILLHVADGILERLAINKPGGQPLQNRESLKTAIVVVHSDQVGVDEEYTCYHFSINLRAGDGQDNVPNLLRHLANSLEKHEYESIQDIVFHNEIDEDGEDYPSFTAYYTK